MTRNVAIALLAGILLGVIGSHQSAKAVHAEVDPPRGTQSTTWPVPHTAMDVLQEDLHRHEVMLQQLRGGVARLTRGEKKLTRACLPTETGGGVEQCKQPTTQDTALRVCLDNDAYFQGHMPARVAMRMLLQCLEDYAGSH